METFLGTLFIIVCILLILVVLLQKGRGGGLGAAFGGAGSSAFGTRTGDVFTWVTIVLTALFLLLAIFSTIVHRPERGTITIGGFAPPPGTNIDREITVRVVDVVPRDAEIHYTLDGLDPTEESKRYPKIGVRVKPGQTLKICAYKAGFNPSEVRSAEYPKIEGVVIVDGTFTSSQSQGLNVTYQDTFLNNPPPGFGGGTATMKITSGSYKQVVD